MQESAAQLPAFPGLAGGLSEVALLEAHQMEKTGRVGAAGELALMEAMCTKAMRTEVAPAEAAPTEAAPAEVAPADAARSLKQAAALDQRNPTVAKVCLWSATVPPHGHSSPPLRASLCNPLAKTLSPRSRAVLHLLLWTPARVLPSQVTPLFRCFQKCCHA